LPDVEEPNHPNLRRTLVEYVPNDEGHLSEQELPKLPVSVSVDQRPRAREL
jgi:hypothetical protein